METLIYEDRAKQIVADIKEILDSKGMYPDSIVENTGFDKETIDKIFSGNQLPSLVEFLALCEISGMTIKLPFVETPDNPM